MYRKLLPEETTASTRLSCYVFQKETITKFEHFDFDLPNQISGLKLSYVNRDVSN